MEEQDREPLPEHIHKWSPWRWSWETEVSAGFVLILMFVIPTVG